MSKLKTSKTKKEKYAMQYARTEANLKRKGKTNKKKNHPGYRAHVK